MKGGWLVRRQDGRRKGGRDEMKLPVCAVSSAS